jgi:uncharacterized protein (TIGR03546 family)
MCPKLLDLVTGGVAIVDKARLISGATTGDPSPMTFLLKQFFALIQLLNSDTATNQIAAGIACGLILGFAPVFSLQTILVFVLLFFFRIQIGAAFLAAFFFKFIAWMLDPVSNRLGMAILETEALQPLFTDLYNMPIVPLTRFYNSIVMGAGALSLLLAIPVFFLAKILVIKYRMTVLARFEQTKAWKVVKATKFYGMYTKYREIF